MYHGSKFQNIFPPQDGSFDGGEGVEKEMTIGCFAWQKWEWTLSLKYNV